MHVEIYSHVAVEELKRKGFPPETAVISFYAPSPTRDLRVSYKGVCDNVIYVELPDVSVDSVDEYGHTEETFFGEAGQVAAFIFDAKAKGLNLICQCGVGTSCSAACAAAILEYFEGRGIEIFADYRYRPNQLVYHKMMNALKACGK